MTTRPKLALRSLSENPLIRTLAAIVMVAASIRLVYYLLAPVFPYLVAAIVLFTFYRIVKWFRYERW